MTKTANFVSASMDQALALGLDCAVAMQHIAHWVAYGEISRATQQYADGEYWAFFSYKTLAGYLPCFSIAQARRIIKEMLDGGWLVKKERYDPSGGQLITWYRPTDKYYLIGNPDTPDDNSAGVCHQQHTPVLSAAQGYAANDTLNRLTSLSKDNKIKEDISYLPKGELILQNNDWQNDALQGEVIAPPAKKTKSDYSADFQKFWEEYPANGASKKDAYKSWNKVLKLGADPLAVIEAARIYAQYCLHAGKLIAHATTWLNQERWEIDYRTLYREEQDAKKRAGKLPPASAQYEQLIAECDAQSRIHEGDNRGSEPSGSGYIPPWQRGS